MTHQLDQFEIRLRRIQERGGTTVTLSIREAELLLDCLKKAAYDSPGDWGSIEIELNGEPF